MRLSEPPDDAAPTMADTFSDRRAVTDWVARSVEVSPESLWDTLTVMPALASLMSAVARSTPANSGGPRTASVPVCGRIVPRLRVRSVDAPESSMLVEREGAQAVTTSALTPSAAMPPSADLKVREREAEAFEKTLILLLAVECAKSRQGYRSAKLCGFASKHESDTFRACNTTTEWGRGQTLGATGSRRE